VNGPALFEETQRLLSNPWALLGAIGAVVGSGSVLLAMGSLGGPIPPGGILGLVVGVGVAGLLGVGRLRTEVRPDGLYVRFVPFTRQHRFSWDEIVSAEARRYRPLLEYGGWGVRWSRSGKAYNVSGNRGVQLELAGGKKLLIGSQRPQALAMAIASARGG